MVVDHTDRVTLRLGRPEFAKFGLALAISLVVHLGLWGAVAVTQKLNLTFRRPPAAPPAAEPVSAQSREPLMFMNVYEDQSVPEPPREAKYYSDRNAIAANPTEDRQLPEPQLAGEVKEVPKLEEAGRPSQYDQLLPDPPRPQETPPLKPGTMAIARADLRPPPERHRPRTIREALLQKNQAAGQRARVEGGATQRPNASYNVKATGFGAYDRMFIDAVSTRWYDLLDNLSYEGYKPGRVVVQFTLNYKGEISNLQVQENTVTETLSLMCVKAIRDPAPFGEWTREMRLAVGEDSRRITFTFYYN
ncbi:MAG TPA: hypothetical protein PKN95_11930 [Verrucomicrobiota bacterium]|nr:hypothetical protein [Verrucomicrobiota bacterium]HNT15528.1 hypothetical protein [Verrucomicrobiota bacterium]